MRRPVLLMYIAALALSGPLTVGTALAAPAPQASPTAAQTRPAAVLDELVVGYVLGATASQRERARGRAMARVAERVVAAAGRRGEVELVRLPPGKNRDQAMAQLQSDPAVSYAEPNFIYSHQATSTDPIFTSPNVAQDLWGMYGDASTPANEYGSQAAEAWADKPGVAGNTGLSTVFVGVIDEGIQFNHPDLSGQVWSNTFDPLDGKDNDNNGYVDDINGWDFAGKNNTIYDGGKRGNLDDHGTHVSGTIGAKANGVGVVGMNWKVTLISGKFLGSQGGTLANAVKAVDYFTDLKNRHKLNIVATNNSWGGGGFSTALLDAITRANAADILFVAAAGNSGTNNDTTVSYPSNYAADNVIAVAAIDRTGALAAFSQYGATTVDLGAPGVGVWSTTAFNSYSSYNGTSMATPHVTGAAALYASTHVRDPALPPGARAAQIKAAILSSVVPTASLNGKTVSGGRLNVSGF